MNGILAVIYVTVYKKKLSTVLGIVVISGGKVIEYYGSLVQRSTGGTAFTAVPVVQGTTDLAVPGTVPYLMNINSILAVIYLTKLQILINLPVMNCSMSSFPY